MITEDYVSFETAKLLKEKGFNECCPVKYKYVKEFDEYLQTTEHVYDGFEKYYYPCPTLQMAMKWLRDEKGIAVIPVLHSVLDNERFLWDIKIIVAETNDTYSQGWVYEELEPGYDRAIRYCLENLI